MKKYRVRVKNSAFVFGEDFDIMKAAVIKALNQLEENEN